MEAAPWGGGRFLVDASAYERTNEDAVTSNWEQAVRADQILVTSGFLLEILYSAQTAADYDEIRNELVIGFEIVYVDAETWQLALRAQQQLAHHATKYQRRYSQIDLLTAAAAHQYHVGVLHYDEDFDEILDQTDLHYQSQWIGEKGTLDRPRQMQPMRARRREINLLLGSLPEENEIETTARVIALLRDVLEDAGVAQPEPLRDDH